jgi:hypothetical protein
LLTDFSLKNSNASDHCYQIKHKGYLYA